MLPLLILWLGIGEQMKVTVIALGVAVNMYINTYASLTGIDSRYVELAEGLDLSRAAVHPQGRRARLAARLLRRPAARRSPRPGSA